MNRRGEMKARGSAGQKGINGRLRGRMASAVGMTLIELIVGLAISSVVSLMAAQFFAMVVRLHRSSTEVSALQKDAQTIGTILERAVMEAEEIYFFDDGSESYLLIGRETGDGAGFSGQILYFDRAEKKLYVDTGYRAGVAKSILFSSVRAKTEITRLRSSEYLVSNKVEELRYTLSMDPRESEAPGENSSAAGVRLSVAASYTMQYHESKSYEYSTCAMTRGIVNEIVWNDRH